jgi:hypothetical protein
MSGSQEFLTNEAQHSVETTHNVSTIPNCSSKQHN